MPALIALSAALFGLACAEPVEDVVRVQPHGIEKSSLEGDWYYRQTIVDRPPQYAIAFTGIEGALEKVRWEIRETQLVATRIHEVVPGLESAASDPEGYVGAPVAVFNITAHYDVFRDYNAQTGEQYNVLVENTTDRPWYERRYMRVDWSSNLVEGPVDFGGLFAAKALGNITQFWVRETELDDPDHMQLTEDFLFFTTAYVVHDGGYNCYLQYGLGWGAPCGPVELKVRHAFARIDAEETRQFEPRPYLDHSPLQTPAEPFTDVNGNGRWDAAEHFTDANGNGRHDAGETFVDRNGNGRWDAAEPFTDLNGNGRWDDLAGVRFLTISAGRTGESMIDVACTREVLDRLGPAYSEADCRDLKFDQFGRFGYFRTERIGYDRRIGGSHDALREFHASHHQMWRRTVDEDGLPIPLSERRLRPIVYHLNPNFPNDLKSTAIKLARDWNDAFIEAAAAATGRPRWQIERELEEDQAKDPTIAVFLSDAEGETYGPRALFQLRDNTCSVAGIEAYLARVPDMRAVVDEAVGEKGVQPGTLERVCSRLTWHSQRAPGVERFVWQQMGDVRFNYIWLVHEDQPGGPLGYGPSSVDLETGRIVSGNAYVYGTALDGYARNAADIVRAMNGDLCAAQSPDQPDGSLDCLIDGRSFETWVRSGTTAADEDLEISESFLQDMSRRLGTERMEPGRPFKGTDGRIDMAEMMRHMRDRVQRPGRRDPAAAAMSAPVDEGALRLAALMQDPSVRARLLDEETLKVVGPLFGWTPGQVVPAEMEELAIELAVDPGAMRARYAEREAFFAERNVYLGDFVDESVAGQALELRGRDPEEVYQILRRDIFEAVMLHEIGHTVGLRHNFKASFDALNYPTEFWEIREHTSEAEWAEARLPEYRYASIMDYGSRFNSDTKGLGRYDHAAIKFVYGHSLERFAPGVRVPGRLDLELEFGDYSKIPELLGGDIENLNRRLDVPVRAVMDEKLNGVLENAALFAENPARAASDYYIERTVPYAFCEDTFRGDLKCRTWDEGANHTESVQAAIRNYWNYFLFNNYRRQRDEGTFLNGFFSRQARLMEYLDYPFKYYTFFDAYPTDLRTDLLRAALTGLNFINQVLGTPSPGRYCLSGNMYYPGWWFGGNAAGCEAVNVPLGVGRNLYLQYSDDYVYKIDYIGVYFDKINFFTSLIDNRTRFIRLLVGGDEGTNNGDNRAYTIGYYKVFHQELVNLLRDMTFSSLGFTVDGSKFHSVVNNGQVRPQLLIDPRVVDGPQRRDPGAARVYSSVPYNLIWRALLLTAALNTNTSDLRPDFADYMTVAAKGSGQERRWEGREIAEFVHPITGQTYVAPQTLDGLSITFDLLNQATAYAQQTWASARRAHEANPADATVRRDWDNANRQLQSMVELLDDMRTIQSLVDWAR